MMGTEVLLSWGTNLAGTSSPLRVGLSVGVCCSHQHKRTVFDHSAWEGLFQGGAHSEIFKGVHVVVGIEPKACTIAI